MGLTFMQARIGPMLILAITAIACSKVVFVFFHDTEGPNILVTIGLAAIIYSISLAVFLSNLFLTVVGFKRISFTIVIQIFISIGIYFGMQ